MRYTNRKKSSENQLCSSNHWLAQGLEGQQVLLSELSPFGMQAELYLKKLYQNFLRVNRIKGESLELLLYLSDATINPLTKFFSEHSPLTVLSEEEDEILSVAKSRFGFDLFLGDYQSLLNRHFDIVMSSQTNWQSEFELLRFFKFSNAVITELGFIAICLKLEAFNSSDWIVWADGSRSPFEELVSGQKFLFKEPCEIKLIDLFSLGRLGDLGLKDYLQSFRDFYGKGIESELFLRANDNDFFPFLKSEPGQNKLAVLVWHVFE